MSRWSVRSRIGNEEERSCLSAVSREATVISSRTGRLHRNLLRNIEILGVCVSSMLR